MQKIINKNIKLLIAVLLLPACICACAVETSPVYYIDNKAYGVTRGLFRSRWWNFYERGCSYADGEFWKEAETDFKKAIQQRDEDLRRARTYGVLNFVDYFPHRELGVCYYHKALYSDAIRELERSIRDTPSAKAYYFLDKARREWLLEAKLDTESPAVVIHRPGPQEITNAFQTEICGMASDDYFVSRIQVGDQALPLEVSKKEISFCQPITLEPERNDIIVKAEDLLGRSIQAAVTIRVDRKGPQLSLEDLDYKDTALGRTMLIKGYVDDENPITRVSFNETDITIPKDQQSSFAFTQRLSLKPEENKIAFLTEDTAGNRNEGIILLQFPSTGKQKASSGDHMDKLIKVACLTGSAGVVTDASPVPLLSQAPINHWGSHLHLAANVIPWRFPGKRGGPAGTVSAEGPRIRFKDLAEYQKSYFNKIYVEGSVQGSNPIKGLTLNGKSIIKRQGKNLFFGIFCKLDPGDNEMVFLAEDTRGKIKEQRIHVEYVVPRVWNLQSRLKVFVIPFQTVRSESMLGEYVSQHFLFTLVNQKRYNVVNREELDHVLVEHLLNKKELLDPKTAVKLGRIAKAEEALVGSVYEGRKSIGIFAQMIDTESSEIILEKDVFHEDKSPETLRAITTGLALKFKNAMPLIEGNIQDLKGDRLYTDLGNEQKIRKGMRVLVFREQSEIVHPETGKVFGCETRELGEAIIRNVEEDRSTGEFYKSDAAESVCLKDKVITK